MYHPNRPLVPIIVRKLILCCALFVISNVAITQENIADHALSVTASTQHLSPRTEASTGPGLLPKNPDTGLTILIVLSSMLLGAVLTATGLHLRMARQRHRLQFTEQRLNLMLGSVDAYVYVKNKHYQYTYANQKMCADLNLLPEQIKGKSDQDLYLHPQTLADIRANDKQVLLHSQQVTAEEVFRDHSGNIQRILLSIKTPLLDPHTQETFIFGISTDLTGLKAVESENHKLTFYDPLTDLPNRRQLCQEITTLLDQSSPDSPTYALFLLDLDRFQQINDARGHAIGDMLLLRVANRLRALLPEDALVARLGGDEFCVLHALSYRPDLSTLQQAACLGEKIRQHIEQPYRIADDTYVTSASIGLTLLKPELLCANDALREADTALNRAKQDGRNLVRAYEHHMQQALEENLSLKHDLLKALNNQQLSLSLQSQFDTAGTISGAEALLRWEHPTRGCIEPAKFIPLAEDNDLILALGEWLLNEVCEVLNATRQYRFPISVNISPTQFNRPDFATRLQQILSTRTNQTHRLIMEITEGTLMENLPAAQKIMADLGTLGIRFSIDDFGVGYSNLSALQRLPLYELKLDRSLIAQVPHDAHSNAITQAVLAMAQQLKLQVVVEGIETPEQLAFISGLGAVHMQGFLLAKPMSTDTWLASLVPPPSLALH